jgi:hypothetical protein
MAKTKRKNHSELESMRGYVRQLEAEIRSLQKQLRQYEKYEQKGQDSEIQTDTEDTYVEQKFSIPCLDCGKGRMVETLEIRGNLYGTCPVCDAKGRIR